MTDGRGMEDLMDQQRQDELHQQASEHYLNGRFQQALQAWSELLRIAPADKRAQEGVRMAGLMVGGSEAPATSPSGAPTEPPPLVPAPPTPAPVAEMPAAPPATPDANTDPSFELADLLDERLGQPAPQPVDMSDPGESPPRAAGQPSADAQPDPERQSDGIDFGDISQVETIALGAPVPVDEPRRGIDGIAEVGDDTDEAAPSLEAPPMPDAPAVETASLEIGAPVEPTPTPPVEPAAAAAGESIQELLPELELDLPDLEPQAPAAPAASSPPRAPVPPRADVSAEVGAPAVEAQLAKRVAALIEDARGRAAQGDRDEALSILSRVAILDDENPEAQALEESLRGEIAAAADKLDTWLTEGVQLMEAGELEQAIDRFKQVLETSPGHLEAQAYLEQAQEQAQSSVEATALEPAPATAPAAPLPPGSGEEHSGARAMEAEPTLAAVPLANTEVATAMAPMEPNEGFQPAVDRLPVEPAPKAAAPKPRSGKLVIFIVLVLLGGVTLTVGFRFFPELMPGFLPFGSRGDEFAEEQVAQARIRTTPALAGPAADASTTDDAVGDEPGAPSGLDAEQKAGQLRDALARARGAARSGDHSAAILAYKEALDLDPNNVEARHGLMQQGELYKQSKQVRQQLDQARLAFEDGDYAAALRLFYRLPEGMLPPERLKRSMANGWYNLAVIALRSGDMERAEDNLTEALSLTPDDAELVRMLDLARRYDGVTKDGLFFRRMESLRFRGVDD